VISVDRQLIAFGNAFVDNATKATDPTYGTEALTKFNVYGTVSGTVNGGGTVNIFNGDEVTGSVGQNVWSCTNEQYWIPTANYSFAAVVDATVATKNAYNMPLTLTTVADNNGNLKDMLYATAAVTNATANQGPVNFTFSHLLSKAQFTVTSNAQGGYYHTVTGIKVSNFETGTYTIAGDGTWAGTTAKDIEFGSVTEVTQTSGAKTNATQMLLVPNAATFNVTFTVDLYKGTTKLGTETKTIAVEKDLVKGNAYNFTIACSVGNPIKFTVTNDPTWSEQTNVPIQ
jgi:hypothetical protein